MKQTILVSICSLAGYTNFLRRDWLDAILSWQTKSGLGCFLDPEVTANSTNSDIHRSFGVSAKIRRRRNELRTDWDHTNSSKHETCLSHFTAMGIAATSIHLRYLVDTCYQSINTEWSRSSSSDVKLLYSRIMK
jgi:hypothetical protein